ncbi:hypothetical protein G210_5249 [Candida maltosa Xu316]|uniref:Uncharacterized protein n=1 Tax=Candida maltosa (strain Xu316) TaxID=1245528 RepID=M3IZY6_CANMX|nr:hypothetical protein G210_5249 [Candida maltosa Xu316]
MHNKNPGNGGIPTRDSSKIIKKIHIALLYIELNIN